MEPTVSYIICGTPRSGSHLLCEALKNTKVAGNPDEYFITDLDGRLENETGNIASQYGSKTLEEFRQLVLELGSTPNGTFGIIIFGNYLHHIVDHYQQLPAYQGLNSFEILDKLFVQPKYIWLTRRDKVRQSVSLVKAMMTDSWIQTKRENTDAAPELIFNFETIEFWRNELEEVDRQWQAYFQAHGITPFKVVYEELVDNYEQTALEILDFLQIPRPQTVAFRERRLRKQADRLNERWVARYHAIKRAQHSTFWRFLLRTEMFIRSVSVRQIIRTHKEHLLAILWYFLLTVAVTWPLASQFNTAVVASLDAQDAIGMLWHTKEVVLGRESLFFMSRLYAPLGITTLTHSIGPVMGLMVLPFWLLGATAVYNAAVLIGIFLTGYCMHLFARDLNLPFYPCLFAGTLFLMAPVHLMAVPAGHLASMFLGLIPLVLLSLHRVLSLQYGRKWIVITAVLFLLLLLHSGLQFILAGMGAGLLVLLRILTAAAHERTKLFEYSAMTALLTLVTTGWLLLQIWHVPESLGIEIAKSSESLRYQPDLIQFLVPGWQTSWLGRSVFADYLRPYVALASGAETAVYISWTAAILGLLACVAGHKTSRQWFWFTLFFILFAFGPNLKVLGETEFTAYNASISMPYAFLVSLPGLDFLRTPGRFMTIAYVGLALLAAFGLHWLLTKVNKRWQPILITAVFALLFLETWPGNWLPSRSLRPVPDFYKQIATDGEQYNVFDLPIRPYFEHTYDSSPVTYSSHYQIYQTVHGKGIASGYLARVYDPHPLFGHIITYNVFDYTTQDNVRVNHQPASRFTNMAYELITHNYRYVVYHKPQTHYSNYRPGSWGELTAQQFVDEVFGQQPPLVDDELVTVYEVPPTTTLQPNMALIDAQSWTTTPVYLHIASPTPQPALLEVQLNHIRDSDDQDLPGGHWLILDMGNSSISREIQAGVMITLPIFLEAGIQTMTLNWHATQEGDVDDYIVSLDWLNLLTEDLPYTDHAVDDGLLLVYGPGWYAPETWNDSGYDWYWGMSPASLWVYTAESGQIHLETAVGAVHDPAANGLGHEAVFTVTVNNGEPHTLAGRVAEPMRITVAAQAGWNEIVWTTESGNFRPIDSAPESGDGRQLGFALRAFSVSFE